MSLRQKLLEGKRGLVPREVIQINTGDEMVDVEVRGLSAGARGEILQSCVVTTEDADGETTRRTDDLKLSIELLILCAYDPETGQPLFAATDREVLTSLSANYLNPVIFAASRLSGISDDVAVAAEKNSERTGDNSSSGSSSPAS